MSTASRVKVDEGGWLRRGSRALSAVSEVE